MRGRKPVPVQLAALHGNPNHAQPTRRVEPPAVTITAEAPEFFDDEHKKEWERVLRDAPLHLLKRADYNTLVAFVSATVLHRRAVIMMQDRRLLNVVNGIPMVNPLLGAIARYATVILRTASELGFTPVSRTRLAVAPGPTAPGFGTRPGQPDRFEQWLAAAPKVTVN
jgi:P27 family predicted phage terminase small subunit